MWSNQPLRPWVKPDYRGGSIVNLMASIGQGLGGAPGRYAPARALSPAVVAGASAVVLMVIDGLGDEFLQASHTGPALLAHRAGRLTSVFPSTTASAVTTFLTGDAPQEHAVTGWHMFMRELGAVITVLPGQARFGGGSLQAAGFDLPAVLGNRPFTTRIDVPCAMLMPHYIADSAYTRAHAGPAAVLPYTDLDGLFHGVRRALASGARYVHAYWPDLDGAGHAQGMCSATASELLGAFDQRFAGLLQDLAGSNTLVVATADHGQLDTTTTHWRFVEDHAEVADALTLPLCGEPRAAFCYVRGRAGAARFETAVARHWGADVDLHDGAAWLADGWFGHGEAHPELASRAGDYVLVPRGHNAVKDWVGPERRYSVIGVHGGPSSAEMNVPLVLASTA